jgi:hypothetical protein
LRLVSACAIGVVCLADTFLCLLLLLLAAGFQFFWMVCSLLCLVLYLITYISIKYMLL